MEEEKTEEIVKTEECCGHKKFGKHFHVHGCCGHKVARAVLLAFVIFAIFSLGVCVGSHRSFNREVRGGRNFNFEQQGGGRMMQNNNFQGQENNGGCRFNGQNSQNRNQNQFQGQVEVQSVPSATIQVVAPAQTQTQVKTVTPVK